MKEWSFIREISKKIMHLKIVLFLLIFLAVERAYDKQNAILALIGILIFFLIIEYLRLELNINFSFFSKCIRPKEEHRMYGIVLFLLGVIVSLAVFDLRVAFAAILMAVLGDIVASIFGSRFGKARLFKNKTAVGLVSSFVMNLIVGFLVLFPYHQLFIVFIMATSASVIETYTDELDDNLLVIIISGFVGQLLISFF